MYDFTSMELFKTSKISNPNQLSNNQDDYKQVKNVVIVYNNWETLTKSDNFDGSSPNFHQITEKKKPMHTRLYATPTFQNDHNSKTSTPETPTLPPTRTESNFVIYDHPSLYFIGILNTHPNNEENSPFDELSFLSASVNRAMAFSSLLDMLIF